LEGVFDQIYSETGRRYHNFEYYGSPTAERIIVLIGCCATTVEETIDYINPELGYNVGMIHCRLYRPWSSKHFMAALPKSCKKIAVLDKIREDGAVGDPLFLDVCATLNMES
jgi:pyruvate-ferredoxin/flavodoxin oxidoreductase